MLVCGNVGMDVQPNAHMAKHGRETLVLDAHSNNYSELQPKVKWNG